jgi:hypothetical protein
MKISQFSLSKTGEPSRTRTCDPLVKSQLLYRLSYRPIYMQRAREGRALEELRGAFYQSYQKAQKAQMSEMDFCGFSASL